MATGTFATAAYAVAGLVLPLFYLPQITICLRDRTGLVAFSLHKCVLQFLLRAAMLPFVLAVGNGLMTFMVLLDFAARGLELGAAVVSLRTQDIPWSTVARRCAPKLGIGYANHPVQRS